MSKKEMLKAVGVSSKNFSSRVKKVVKKYWKPYVDSKGELCFLLNEMPIYGGAEVDNYISTC